MDSLISLIVGLAMMSVSPQITYVAPPVQAEEVEVVSEEVILPQALKEVCGCESNWNPYSDPSQFDSSGLPLQNKNFDDLGNHWSTDWGACQINDFYWDAEALSLGLDYKNNRDDNYRLALHILEKQGIGAWGPSGQCHGKTLDKYSIEE